MSDRIDRVDPTLAAIKKLAPSSLKLILRDGTERAVAMPKSRNKWSRLRESLDSLAWERIECLDRDGRLIGGAIEAEDVTDEVGFDDGDSDDTTTLKQAMQIMLEVQRMTIKETRLIFEAQTKGQSEMVNMMVEGMRAMQDSYALAMRTQAASLVAGSGAQEGSEMMDMFKMAMMMQSRGLTPPQSPPKVPSKTGGQ
jgi:hypothetical protein